MGQYVCDSSLSEDNKVTANCMVFQVMEALQEEKKIMRISP